MRIFHPPVAIEREWLILGYLLYAVLAGSFIFAGAPSLDQTVRIPGYTQLLGILMLAFLMMALWGSFADRRFRIEMVGSLGVACCLAGYFVTAAIVLAGRHAADAEGRVAFTVVVFIVTAVMWARGLSLLKRAAFDKVAKDNAAHG